ncbi:phosphotransferase [Caulobacter sp. SLTY]|nr:phosphotransferase [Caulobacter sp. SLTY]
MHADEIDIDAEMVRRLVGGQFPEWADLTVRPAAVTGTDHRMFRLGEALAVRLPRHARAAGQVAKEARWLQRLGPALPCPVPIPLAVGAPGEGFPLAWSVCLWLGGEPPPSAGGVDLGRNLAAFVAALRRQPTDDAPPPGPDNSWRGVPLARRERVTQAALGQLEGEIDVEAARAAWARDRDAPAWTGAPVWIHGDLQAGNLLTRDGRLAAVLDFGCLAVGDPACDLQPAWFVLGPEGRAAFRDALQADDADWARGRGWALSVALLQLPYYRDSHPALANGARVAINAVLVDL